MQGHDDVVQVDMIRVKNLPVSSKLWVASTRPLDEIYHEDPITLLKGAGKFTATKLNSSNMISIGDLLHATHLLTLCGRPETME